MKIKKISKYTSPINHILINDEGIGSNRILISNNYLNNYNYFNKNNIKMLNIHKRKYLENKYKKEEIKKEKSIPELAWSASYYIYFNKTNNDYIRNDKNNNELKKEEINYLQDIYQNENYIKFNSRKNRIKKTFRIYDDLINKISNTKHIKIKEEINELYNNKNYTTDIKNKNKNKNEWLFDDDDFYFFNRRKNRFDDIKCNVIFGKTLSTDYELRLKQNGKKNKNNYSNKKNNAINNKKYFKSKYDDPSLYNKFNILSKSYGKGKFGKKEQKILIEDNSNNRALPLINKCK